MSSIAFSPDGQRIATGSYDHTARVWESAGGRQLLVLNGHGKGITSILFSQDGQRIFTGSQDTTARVWEAARPGDVAEWEREDRAAAEARKGWQKELSLLEQDHDSRLRQERIALGRADEGALQSWRVLAPIPFLRGESSVQALEREQIPNESSLRPTRGQEMAVRGFLLKWQDMDGDDYALDFPAGVGRPPARSVGYAACHLFSEIRQDGVQLRVGCQGGLRVFLNAQPVYQAFPGHTFVADQETVGGLVLRPGWNLVVCKSVNETPPWRASLRLVDARGQPLRGIRVRLDPDPVEFPK